jgi:hypothetical protein
MTEWENISAYRDLKFADTIYNRINQYQEQKASAE